MRALIRLASLTSLAALALPVACDGATDNRPIGSANGALVKVSGDNCTPLIAGQYIPVGSVCTEVVGDNLVVVFETVREWSIDEAHLWAGTALADMPQTRTGNPQNGHFPFSASGPTNTVSFDVPLSTFGLAADRDVCVPVDALLAAHAAVSRSGPSGTTETQTAWGEGQAFTARGNWGTFSTFALVCVEDADPAEPETAWMCDGTAIAYAADTATCFSELGITRWGWTNGPLDPGSYSFDVLEGAAQCDPTKGTKVATVGLEYDGESATVTLVSNEGRAFEGVHVYVGNDPMPRQGGAYTANWGHYPHGRSGDVAGSWETTVAGLSGAVHFVLHAESCHQVEYGISE